MHSRVFVLSHGKDRITEDDYIFEQLKHIADYAIERREEREKDIEWLLKAYPSIFELKEDGSLNILSEGVTEYFETKLEALKTLVDETTVDSIRQHKHSLFRLKDAVEDEYGFYFYTDDDGLETVDSFLEDVLCGYIDTTWNIVQTIDYHW